MENFYYDLLETHKTSSKKFIVNSDDQLRFHEIWDRVCINVSLLKTKLPETNDLKIDGALPTLLYNFYNLDSLWRKEEFCNRVLLLEPEIFNNYPISEKSIDFMLGLSNNIIGLQVYVGSFNDLIKNYNLKSVVFKEHPLNSHYKGIEDNRDWMFENKNNLNSFFSYWKKSKKIYFKSLNS